MENFWEANFLDIVFRSVITFIVILVLARIIGKKQLSQLTFFHYITGITIGSIAGEITTQIKTPFFDGIIALSCWTILTLLMSFISIKSTKIRVIVDDRPTILIQNGMINQHGLKKQGFMSMNWPCFCANKASFPLMKSIMPYLKQTVNSA